MPGTAFDVHSRPLRVLSIEDNPGDARLFQKALALAHAVRFDVHLAPAVEPALSRLQSEVFDAVVLDLGLPGYSRLEALRVVRRAAPELPLIVFSGLVDEQLALRAIQQGADDFLVKRYGEPEQIARAICYAIVRRRAAAGGGSNRGAQRSKRRELARAIDRDELVLHYQPKIDAQEQRIVGTEALVRWRHPRLGLLGPDEFVPFAERHGLISALGDWVLAHACRQTRRWQEQVQANLRVAVNVSPRQLDGRPFVDRVLHILRDTGLDPRHLELELTESHVHHQTRAVATLRDLHAMGIQISMDDFGTGYGFLSHLSALPVDTLKIGPAFVLNLGKSSGDTAIVDGIISIAHSLGQTVTAEGVETADQLAYLRRSRCDQLQGFFFSRPQPAELLTPLLSQPRFGQICPKGCLPKPALH